MRTKLLLLMAFALMGWSNVWAYDKATEGTQYYGSGIQGIGLSDGTVAAYQFYEGEKQAYYNGVITVPATLQVWSGETMTAEYEVSTVGTSWSPSIHVGEGESSDWANVTKIVISEGITTIAANAFTTWATATNLKEVVLPSTLTTIGNYAFYYCDGLTSVTFKSVEAPTYGTNAFATSASPWYHENCIVTVPEGSMDSYGNSSNWYWNQIRYTAKHMREAANITIGEVGYATYYNDHGYILPEGLEGWVVDWTYGTTANLNKIYNAGDEVYAGTNSQFALLLKRTDSDGGDKTFTLSVLSSGGETATWPDGISKNLLCGSQTGGTTTAWGTESSDYYYYKLAKDKNDGLGWYWGADDGAAFTSAAHKAWLVVSKSASARSFIGFGDETTAIESVVKKAEINDGVYYNLQGQRVDNPTKGLYIVNGKKVIIK